jgi:hypothetical protein
MIRNLKALGLALIVVFAMSAITTSGAQAQKLTIESATGFITGTQPVGAPTILDREGRTVTCDTATYTATVGSGDSTFNEVIPAYSECHSPSLKGPATVTMNSCYYVFHLVTDAGGTQTATVDIECKVLNDHIDVHIYANHENHTKVPPVDLCTYQFSAQTGLATIDLTNEPAGGITPKDWILAHVTIAGVKSKRVAGTALNCGAENGTNAKVTGTVILKGENHAGAATGITIS